MGLLGLCYVSVCYGLPDSVAALHFERFRESKRQASESWQLYRSLPPLSAICDPRCGGGYSDHMISSKNLVAALNSLKGCTIENLPRAFSVSELTVLARSIHMHEAYRICRYVLGSSRLGAILVGNTGYVNFTTRFLHDFLQCRICYRYMLMHGRLDAGKPLGRPDVWGIFLSAHAGGTCFTCL